MLTINVHDLRPASGLNPPGLLTDQERNTLCALITAKQLQYTTVYVYRNVDGALACHLSGHSMRGSRSELNITLARLIREARISDDALLLGQLTRGTRTTHTGEQEEERVLVVVNRKLITIEGLEPLFV